MLKLELSKRDALHTGYLLLFFIKKCVISDSLLKIYSLLNINQREIGEGKRKCGLNFIQVRLKPRNRREKLSFHFIYS